MEEKIVVEYLQYGEVKTRTMINNLDDLIKCIGMSPTHRKAIVGLLNDVDNRNEYNQLDKESKGAVRASLYSFYLKRDTIKEPDNG